MGLMHVGIISWHPACLEQSSASLAQSFAGHRFIVCCPREAKERAEAALGAAERTVFSPEDMRSSLGGVGREDSIGHTRNLLQAASKALDPSAPLVLLDDDIAASPQTASRFEAACARYDIAQGRYEGYCGNRIYALVSFFEILSDERGSRDFGQKVQDALRGRAPMPQGSQNRSVVGGLLALSPRFKAKNAFAPTPYPFDDHFFDFSSRFLFPPFRFMDGSEPDEEIPLAVHSAARSESASKMVDAFVKDVKASAVESYFYFRLSGCLPKIVGGRHVLVKADGFDAENAAKSAMEDAAVAKFSLAARNHLLLGAEGELAEQLERIATLGFGDFFVPQEELEAEWRHFEAERAWLANASERCGRGGREALGGIPGS